MRELPTAYANDRVYADATAEGPVDMAPAVLGELDAVSSQARCHAQGLLPRRPPGLEGTRDSS